MIFYYLCGDPEPQPSVTVQAAASISPPQPFGAVSQGFFRKAGSLVEYGDLPGAFCHGTFQKDRTCGRSIFYGVIQKLSYRPEEMFFLKRGSAPKVRFRFQNNSFGSCKRKRILKGFLKDQA